MLGFLKLVLHGMKVECKIEGNYAKNGKLRQMYSVLHEKMQRGFEF